MKTFHPGYFDFSQTWSWPKLEFYFRKNFYCYVWPQRCMHMDVLKPGVYVNTKTNYYWLNMVLNVYHTRPMNDGEI